MRARATKWTPVSGSTLGLLDGILVPLPVDLEIRLDANGRVTSIQGSEPSAESLEEAAGFVESLAANRQVATDAGPLPPGTTHRVEVDPHGRRLLQRTRFLAG